MPKLVPFLIRKATRSQRPKKPIHERLGGRNSVSDVSQCESIHTSQLALFRPNFKAKTSVHNRLQRNFISPAMIQRNKIAITALHSFTTQAMKQLDGSDTVHGNLLLNAFNEANSRPAICAPIEREYIFDEHEDQKYDVLLQDEIRRVQVSIVATIGESSYSPIFLFSTAQIDR